jgi:hypothetical protein
MNDNNLSHQFQSLGLFSDPVPKTSIMQMKLLEEEAIRHFPQMDAKARAIYVSNSIEQVNKTADHGQTQRK